METLVWMLQYAAGKAPLIPLDEKLRPTWLFGKTVHEGCDRAGYYEQGDFAVDYNTPRCQVKIGCWGPVVNCNVPKRGWMHGIGGCPNVGGVCIGCTMPGFPDKFMPFMDQPPGAALPRDPRAARDHEQDDGRGAEVAPQRAGADQRLRPALRAR
jgi:hydrogenase small subunit